MFIIGHFIYLIGIPLKEKKWSQIDSTLIIKRV